MFDEVTLLPMTSRSVRAKVEAFLERNGLRPAPLDCYAAILDDDERIVAGGGLDGDVIKCVAVSEEARSGGCTNKLISFLVNRAVQQGYGSVKVFTKPSNAAVFGSLGFSLLASAPEAVLMENGRIGLNGYERYLSGLRRPGRNGVIVMNANPFTLGHRYLVEQASRKVDNLYVIAVKEDRSRFPYAERKAMIAEGCESFGNVTVCEGSDYVISQATFPTYFLKKLEDAADTQMALDLDLFATRIAPALGAGVRFAGSESADPLTGRYNSMMAEILPKHGIAFEEIGRLGDSAGPVSASRVREALDAENLAGALALCPASTAAYLLSECAVCSLQKELDATPKPGLVDKAHSGSHHDMDYSMMSLSIKALRPFFTTISLYGKTAAPDPAALRAIGIEAEKAMFGATGGVNTHKGALFCMGLSVCAAADCLRRDAGIGIGPVRSAVRLLAAGIPAADGTHGADAVERYKVAGALQQAREAWPRLFSDWLPFYRSLGGDPFRMQKTLLRIMSDLDDTNVIHRLGAGRAAEVKEEAASLLRNFTPEGLEAMDKEFMDEGISPGGSADMLSLTIFYNTITNQQLIL